MKNPLLNILYTPLDLAPPPPCDPEKLINWIDTNKEQLEPYKQYAYDNRLTSEKNTQIAWPWNMGLAYLNWDNTGPGWLCNFNKEFPDLSDYMYKVFDIPIEELGTIVILPIRKKHTGFGFLHQDPGDFGIRIYLEFEHIGQNKLFLQKTRVPYMKRPDYEPPIDPNILQKELIECKTLSNRGCWFINNTRAFHCTYTEVEDSTRVTVIVSGNASTNDKILQRLTPKIISSAEKFKDHAVFW
jgi:hypothetical protein